MNNLLGSKYWWLYSLLGLVVLNYLASVYHYRLDLTQEKRFTLSKPTVKLLRSLNDRVSITVFLEGNMPAGFRKLSASTKELLQDFKEYSKSNITYKFMKAGEGMNDSVREAFFLKLDSLGLRPTNINVRAKEGETNEQRMIYPGALISYKDREVAIDLLQGQNMAGGASTSLNNAEALLEYKFAHSIEKITADSVPLVGYLIGNGEPLTYNFVDLIDRTLKLNYRFAFFPLDKAYFIPSEFNAIVIVKPTLQFSDRDKLKIDQYIMRGGKVIWLIDNLYAEMDSLRRKQTDFIAFDRGLNLSDQLFKYGVRINLDLVQDLQCDKIPMVVGNYGGQPQVQLIPWPYFPLLSSSPEHPISKNLGNVLSIFPNSIDTVITPGIKKTILLSTSSSSRTLSTPAIVSFNSAKTEEDLRTFNRASIPVSFLLEGKFQSLFTNRLPGNLSDTLSNVYHQPFLPSSTENKMIVVADADIVSNVVTQEQGPLYMGYNQFTQLQYANKDFFLNCMEYLVNPSGIMKTRAKDYTLRLLDPKKIEQEKIFWQFVNIGVPVLLVIIFGLIYQPLRKRKYSH